jgi:hypothetical protein
MASNVNVDPFGTPQDVNKGKRDLALQALDTMSPEATMKRAKDRSTIATGEALGGAMSRTGASNYGALALEGTERVKKDMQKAEEDLLADSFTNQFSMFDKLDETNLASKNLKADAVAAIDNEVDTLGGITGYMTDSDEEKLKRFIADEIANLPVEEQWEIWTRFKDEMFDIHDFGGQKGAIVGTHFTDYTGNPVPTKT